MKDDVKIGDRFEFLAKDMAPGVADWLGVSDTKFSCRVVSLIFKAGRCVATGILWDCDEEYKDQRAKMLLNEDFMGRVTTAWAWKGKKIT